MKINLAYPVEAASRLKSFSLNGAPIRELGPCYEKGCKRAQGLSKGANFLMLPLKVVMFWRRELACLDGVMVFCIFTNQWQVTVGLSQVYQQYIECPQCASTVASSLGVTLNF